jgi:hypothetical protein
LAGNNTKEPLRLSKGLKPKNGFRSRSGKMINWVQELMNTRRARAIAGAIIAIIVMLLVPFKTTVVPAWKLQVVNMQAIPCGGLVVVQSWRHYSLDMEGGEHLESRSTDKDGWVDFPERTIRKSVLGRLFANALTLINTLFHGSRGIRASISASGPPGYGEVNYQVGKPMPQQLVLVSYK